MPEASDFSWDSHYKWYDWEEQLTITFQMSSDMDSWSDRKIYNFLDGNKDSIEDEVQDYLVQNVPEIGYYWSRDGQDALDEAYDQDVYYQPHTSIYYVTPDNTYETAFNVSDYYVLNGKDHFLRDKDSIWSSDSDNKTKTTEAGKTSGGSSYKKSSGSSGNYDNPNGYNMDDYSSYEDLYDDNPEDFDGLDDAEDYFDEYGDDY